MAKTAAKDLNNLQMVYIPSTVKDGHSRKVGLWSRAGYERYRFAARYHHAKIGPQCTGIGRQFISKTLPTLTRISLAFSLASWRMKFTICRIWSVAAMVKFLQRFFTIKKEKKKDISAAICRCQRQSDRAPQSSLTVLRRQRWLRSIQRATHAEVRRATKLHGARLSSYNLSNG